MYLTYSISNLPYSLVKEFKKYILSHTTTNHKKMAPEMIGKFKYYQVFTYMHS